MSEQTRKKLVEVTHLRKEFPIKRSITDVLSHKPKKSVKAVDDVTLDIYEKEILALVGESGCGKSSFARTLIRLYNPDDGKIVFDGQDITHMKRGPLRPIKKEMQMVFQDPYSSLNPRQLIGDIFREELLYHKICATKAEAEKKVEEILKTVGMDMDATERFPSEFSGGQRQRIGIARALAVNPKLVVADEPVSALDVSIQAQILNLMKNLQKEFDLTILFISHDLRVVRHISDRVAVMYLGKIMELGNTDDVYNKRLHPYTDILLRSAPNLDPRIREEKALIEGNPPSPIDVPPGCRFSKRCKKAMPICFEQEPTLREMEPGHFCACHLYDQTNSEVK